MQMHLSETDASLLSWLHALPIDTFSCPFEEKPLKLNMDRFVKPNLEATWADAILGENMYKIYEIGVAFFHDFSGWRREKKLFVKIF